MDKALEKTGVNIITENYLEDIKNVYNRGDSFEKIIVIEQAWTRNGQYDFSQSYEDEYGNQTTLREQLIDFISDLSSRFNGTQQYVFLTSQDDAAEVIHSEIVQLADNAAVVMIPKPLSVKFMVDLVLKDVCTYDKGIVYQPKEVYSISDDEVDTWQDQDNSWNDQENNWGDQDNSWNDQENNWQDQENNWGDQENNWGDQENNWGDQENSWNDQENSWNDQDNSWNDQENNWQEPENIDNWGQDNSEFNSQTQPQDPYQDPFAIQAQPQDPYQDPFAIQAQPQDPYQDPFNSQDPYQEYSNDNFNNGYDYMENTSQQQDPYQDPFNNQAQQQDPYQDPFNNQAQQQDPYQDPFSGQAQQQDPYPDPFSGQAQQQDPYQDPFSGQAQQQDPYQDPYEQDDEPEDEIDTQVVKSETTVKKKGLFAGFGKKAEAKTQSPKSQQSNQAKQQAPQQKPKRVKQESLNPYDDYEPEYNNDVDNNTRELTDINLNDTAKLFAAFANRGNSIMVTGAPGAGTQTVAYHLANILRLMNYNVLLVDFDVKGRQQTYIQAANYNATDHDEVRLAQAVNSSQGINQYIAIASQNLHLLNLGLDVDEKPIEQVIQRNRVMKFANQQKNGHHFVIYDVPFEYAAGHLEDITTMADNIVVVQDSSTWGAMKTLLYMMNVGDDAILETFFNKAQILFNRYKPNAKILGEKIRRPQDIQRAMDKQLTDLVGADIGYSFRAIHVCGTLNFNQALEDGWLNKDKFQWSATKDGQKAFVEILKSIVFRGNTK